MSFENFPKVFLTVPYCSKIKQSDGTSTSLVDQFEILKNSNCEMLDLAGRYHKISREDDARRKKTPREHARSKKILKEYPQNIQCCGIFFQNIQSESFADMRTPKEPKRKMQPTHGMFRAPKTHCFCYRCLYWHNSSVIGIYLQVYEDVRSIVFIILP